MPDFVRKRQPEQLYQEALNDCCDRLSIDTNAAPAQQNGFDPRTFANDLVEVMNIVLENGPEKGQTRRDKLRDLAKDKQIDGMKGLAEKAGLSASQFSSKWTKDGFRPHEKHVRTFVNAVCSDVQECKKWLGEFGRNALLLQGEESPKNSVDLDKRAREAREAALKPYLRPKSDALRDDLDRDTLARIMAVTTATIGNIYMRRSIDTSTLHRMVVVCADAGEAADTDSIPALYNIFGYQELAYNCGDQIARLCAEKKSYWLVYDWLSLQNTKTNRFVLEESTAVFFWNFLRHVLLWGENAYFARHYKGALTAEFNLTEEVVFE